MDGWMDGWMDKSIDQSIDGRMPKKKIQYNQPTKQPGKKSQTIIFHLSGEKPPLNGLK